MKKQLLFLSLLMLTALLGFTQTTLKFQDFEGGTDDWNFTPNPVPYNVSGDTWDTVASLHAGAITPQSGSLFWGMRDLDNPNGGGDFRHTLSFDAVDVSAYSNVTVSFYYYTDGYDSHDSIFYNVQYDNGSNWPLSGDVELNKNTDAWTLISISVPAGNTYVRLQLSAHQNGGSDYAGFDNVLLQYGAGGNTTHTAFYEPFETDLDVMSTYDVMGSSQVWVWANYGNPAGCSKMSGYNGSGYDDNEDWLITPAIDLTGYSNISLHFDHARNFGDNTGLFVLVSDDYDGTSDPSTQGTWNDVTSQFTFPASGSWSFIDAGTVDITSYTGASTYIAYKYTSTTTSGSTWEVDNITVAGNPPPVFIVGSFQGWTPGDSSYLMSMNNNGVYVLTKNLPAGDNEYKAVEGPDWSYPNYPSTNQHIVLAVSTDTSWQVNRDADLVMHTLPVVTGDFFSSMGGNNWDPTELMGEMQDPDGDDAYTLTLLVPSGNWECKVALNQNWDQNTGDNTSLTSNGVDSTTFTYDFATNTTSVNGPPPPTATVTFIVYDTTGRNYDGFNLKGSWDTNGNYDSSWNGGNEHSPFYDDGTNSDSVAGDHIWTCQQQLVVDNGANTWEWGVNDTDHNWVAGNWQFTVTDTNAQTQSWEVPVSPALVINEIMYNSPGADEEWIELYNNSSQTISLENWKVLDNNASHSPIIFPAGYTIEPDSFFTVEVATNGNFPFTPDYDGSGHFSLGNSGDAVRLWNANGILVDIVNYDDSPPWPTAPDGNGPSLALIDPSEDNSLASSWDASDQDGGTPGAINFPPIPFITVITPNGGENITQGSDYEITWSYGFWNGNVEIDLQKGNNSPQLLAYNVPLQDTSWMWHVFDNQEIGDDYKILIYDIDSADPGDKSDTAFSIIEPYVIPDLVFTEIMYNPPETGNDSLEFIEIYNNGNDTVDMKGFSFAHGVNYTFPSITVYPNTFLLVSKDSVAILNTFAVNAWQWTSGSLSNSGEDIELVDSLGNQVDNVDYDDQLPWDTLADGYGPSLTLCNPNLDNSVPQNWTHSVHFAAVNAAGDSIWATPDSVCQVLLMAAFSADTTLVVIADSVLFTDQTTGNPSSWTWTFDGGTPASFVGQNPPYIYYNIAGRWDVILVVSDGTNNDTATYPDYIWSGVAPVADFVADETTILVGNFGNFSSLSTGDSLTYSWTFAGGTPHTSANENPTVYYYIQLDTTYNVSLVVNNIFGTDSLTKPNYIHTIPSGIDENNRDDLLMFPNPAKNVLYISNNLKIPLKVSIVDLTGREMLKQSITSDKNKLNISKLNKGVYLVNIIDPVSKTAITKKLVIN